MIKTTINKENKEVKLEFYANNGIALLSETTLREGDELTKNFLDKTKDKHAGKLCFLEVEDEDGNRDLKAFYKRNGYDSWFEEFNANELVL